MGQSASYLFDFIVRGDIPKGGYIRLTFPNTRVLKLNTTTISCKSGTTTLTCNATYNSTGLQYILISGVCPTADCVAPITYNLTLTGGMLNPGAVIPITGYFTIETLSPQGYITS